MVSGRARVLQQTDPRKCLVTYKGRADRWSPIWDGNPRIARLGEAVDFQELPARGMDNQRPYHSGKTAERWTYNLDFRPDVGELYFTDAERVFGALYPGRLILEPNIKPGASPNKQWGVDKWERLARLLRAAGMCCAQVGPAIAPRIEGVELIVTPSFRMACAVLAHSPGCVLPEGGLHHAAAALNVTGVVIFGGFTPVELTGYAIHRNLGASLGDACGNRQPCPHCAAIMENIAPGQVFDELRGILNA